MAAKNKKLTLYILHGWVVDPEVKTRWQPFLDLLKKNLLEKADFKIKFLALPGLSAPLKTVWKLSDYLNWLEKQLASDIRQAGSVYLLGHSFGGQLAIRYSAQHPNQVKKMILIASSGIRDHSLKARLKRSIFYRLAKTGKTLCRAKICQKILYKLARESDYLKAPANMKKTMANVITEEILTDLAAVKADTLIIWGRQDTTIPLKNAYLKQKLIVNSQLKIIDEARHSPMYTHPEKTATLIRNFL